LPIVFFSSQPRTTLREFNALHKGGANKPGAAMRRRPFANPDLLVVDLGAHMATDLSEFVFVIS
jgi:hypothetical protein